MLATMPMHCIYKVAFHSCNAFCIPSSVSVGATVTRAMPANTCSLELITATDSMWQNAVATATPVEMKKEKITDA